MGLALSTPNGRRRPPWAAVACGLLVAAFAAVSFSAAVTKSATPDEPLHALAGWVAIRSGDVRLEVENPPLWKAWAALGDAFTPLAVDRDPAQWPVWRNPTWDSIGEIRWARRTLYGTPGNDGAAFVNRARAMMLAVAVGLAALVAAWAGRLAGPGAAVVATALFCCDPTVLAHAPLVKSDVALGLALTGLAALSWRVGRRATLGGAVGLGLLCGAAVGTKFSGLIAGPILAALLAVRAAHPAPWPAFRRLLGTRPARLAGAAVVGGLAAAVCYGVVWASYGFRFRPAPDPAVRMDMATVQDRTRFVETAIAVGRVPTAADLARYRPGGLARFVGWADAHHALPQAFLVGLSDQRNSTHVWEGFLDGQWYGTGRWSYFPLAVLYKTPVAELAAVASAAVVLAAAVVRRRRVTDAVGPGWAAACLGVPFAIYAAATLGAHLNIGLRSALPLYPFAAVAGGWAAAIAFRRRPRTTTMVAALLGVGTVAEVAAAWPDYIPFFNVAVGGPSGGFAHLSDSNLDWGQDLPALADWQRHHPTVPLFLSYCGNVDPHFYGLRYHTLSVGPDGRPTSDVGPPPPEAAVAVSATYLRGLYLPKAERPFYLSLAGRPPAEVLHGTVYLFRGSDVR